MLQLIPGGPMRRLFAWLLPLLLFPSLNAQTPPQTARQALIEMFFGTSPNHLEKHLPDTTRNTFKRMSNANGMSMLDEFSAFANMVKVGGAKFETFDTGPTLLQAEEAEQNEKTEITVEATASRGMKTRLTSRCTSLRMGQNRYCRLFRTLLL
jgi:hypothetical protein